MTYPTLFAAMLLLCVTATLGAAEQKEPKFTNRLAKEKSPYLLQHAHNPVDWYPWGEEAFAKVRKEGKPIFLSVGYSTCHWCHVMEREAFSDEAVAKILNEKFVPIKVDREERPDVDRVYMTYVTASTGSGGWPMTVILTPDLKPIFGGTYFPLEDKFGQPGIKRLLTKITDVWATDRKAVEETAESVTKQLREMTKVPDEQSVKAEQSLLDNAYQHFAGRFDEKHGGFGAAPKFPTSVELNFLLVYAQRANQPKVRDMVLQTLRAMSAGGIRDHLGGGFHRYSTDARWFLPHFEKMLYDQAQLASIYLDAYQITRDPQYANIARETFEYVLRDLTSPEGRFYSAEDADSAPDPAKPEEKSEGAFYVWTAAELAAAGQESAEIFQFHYGIKPDGNVQVDPHKEFTGKNVVFEAHTITESAKQFGKSEVEIKSSLTDAQKTLLTIRSKRLRPHLDDKTIVAWNSLMISALACGGPVLKEPRYTDAAVKAASFIRDKLYDAKSHELTRVYRDGPSSVPGFLEDYANYIESLLDLYESTLDIQWMRLAIDLQATQNRLFGAPDDAGFFVTREGDSNLLFRMKDDSDGVEPSGNSVSARNLLRLSQMTGDEALTKRADRTLRVYAATLSKAPAAMPRMLAAIDFHLDKPRQIVIAGDPHGDDTRAIMEAVYGEFLHNRIILGADAGPGQAFLSERLAFIRDMKPVGNRATAYVCENFACQRPTNDINELKRQLAQPTR